MLVVRFCFLLSVCSLSYADAWCLLLVVGVLFFVVRCSLFLFVVGSLVRRVLCYYNRLVCVV